MSRRGQLFRPKRYVADERHPFRKTASGFENLISQERSDDFFFSRWLDNPDDAAEFLEHGGEDRDPLASDPRSGLSRLKPPPRAPELLHLGAGSSEL